MPSVMKISMRLRNNYTKLITHSMTGENWTILGIYRSPKVSMGQPCEAISEVINTILLDNSIIVGNFNINWLIETERRPLYSLLVTDKGYKELISTLTTDNKIAIDYIYTFTYPTWMSKQVF